MLSIPLVSVQQGQIVSRAKSLNCTGLDISAKPIMPLEEALETRWNFDAHFFSYHLLGDNPEPTPPVAKGVLKQIRNAGSDLVTSVLSFDVDTIGHDPWTEKTILIFLRFWDEIIKNENFPIPYYFYTTTHGVRLLYVLEEPISVDEAEQYHKGLTEKLSRYQFPNAEVDIKCSNWDRCFRLPMVIREGKKTWEHRLYLLSKNEDKYLDLSKVPKSPYKTETTFYQIPEGLEKPTLEEAFRLMYTKKNQLTEWHKIAKKFLKGRECYPCCFEEDMIADPGHRNSTIQTYVGQACAMLCDKVITTPQRLYALFINSVYELEPDEQTSDWTQILWDAVLKYYYRELAKHEDIKKQEQLNQETTEEKLDRIISRMQNWSDSPILNGPDINARRDYARKHLICVSTNSYHVMSRTGFYYKIGTMKPHEIPALVSRLGMDDLIALKEVSGRSLKSVSPMELLSRHGTIVGSIEGSLNTIGNFIQNIDTENAKLMMSLFRLKKHLLKQAKFHPEVDKWLKYLVAGDDYYTLENWIANALAFDEGAIAALSLTGPPGVGKKLIVQGLAECINTEVLASSKEFGKYGERLLQTCFLNVNEGLPKSTQGVTDVADSFRHFVSGDVITISQKYKPKISIRNPLRIIFTANNLDVVQQLAGHRELTQYDQEALALRLIHMKTQQKAADYLKALGGMNYTARSGNRWIRGDQGQPSDYIVAKHFLHLYHTVRKKYPRGDRFLVEGSIHSGIINEMKLRMGVSPQIIECLITMIETPNPQGMRGFAQERNRIYVTNYGVTTQYKKLFPNEKINNHALRKVLNSLSIRTIKGRKKIYSGMLSENLYWKELDLLLLLSEAEKNGYDHAKLQDLVTAKIKGKENA